MEENKINIEEPVVETEEAAAEAVEEIVAAISKEQYRPISIPIGVLLIISHTINPVIAPVISTPNVAKVTPGAIIGFISLIFVSIPPEKRIMHKATVPIVCVISKLSKWMPNPSTPNNIPTPKKRSKIGTPNLLLILLTMILAKNNAEIISRRNSIGILVDLFLY